MSKRKIITIVVAVVVVAAAAGGLWFLLRGGNGGGSGEDKVYVESVASLSNVSYGVQNRYSGVIEPQKSLDIKKNPEKQVKISTVNTNIFFIIFPHQLKLCFLHSVLPVLQVRGNELRPLQFRRILFRPLFRFQEGGLQ